jgi:hypothetical protein
VHRSGSIVDLIERTALLAVPAVIIACIGSMKGSHGLLFTAGIECAKLHRIPSTQLQRLVCEASSVDRARIKWIHQARCVLIGAQHERA